MTDIAKIFKTNAIDTERKLEEIFEGDDSDLSLIREACLYSLLAGGKRIRPTLVLETCRMLGGDEQVALSFAAAIEMIHTYSLIHDDLPCMDDDDLRRGKPTSHKVYGEAFAVLAGDTLLTEAFGVAANSGADASVALSAVKVLSECAGYRGMIGGQVMDIYGEEHTYTEDKLKKLHALKTGALIRASVLLGALSAGVYPTDKTVLDLALYAEKIGLAFQIVDDILDSVGDEKLLGKRVGVDLEHSKNTFLSFHSISEASEYAERLTSEAIEVVSKYEKYEVLASVADYLAKRNY